MKAALLMMVVKVVKRAAFEKGVTRNPYSNKISPGACYSQAPGDSL